MVSTWSPWMAFATAMMLVVVPSVHAFEGLRPRRRHLRELREYFDGGVAGNDQGIVGGNDVTDNTFPWMARFANNGANCGGALIQSDRVLTSAKCLKDLYGGSTDGAISQTVNIGAWDTSNTGEDITIECVVVHPNFDDSTSIIKNDIAVVILQSSSSKTTVPGSANPDVTNGNLQSNPSWTLIGFGATSAGSTTPSTTLRNVSLPYVSLSNCQNSYSNGLTEGNHFCAGGSSGSGGCSSDTGGILMGINVPLTVNQVWTAIGVYSFSSPNCGQGAPDVFTDIAYYVDSFIQPALSSSSCPSTPSPTAPTPAPTGGDCVCFSGSATVQVVQEVQAPYRSPIAPPPVTPVAMKDLQVGQKVFAGYADDKVSSRFFGNNKVIKTPIYETVYGFGHRNEEIHTEYLQITTTATRKGSGGRQPLEVSASHLIFVHGKEVPVRADSLQVGDQLIHKSLDHDITTAATIIKIERVVRKGMYAPFTKDGTILVDGLEASNYVSVKELSPRVLNLGLKIFTEHGGFHWWVAPYRFVCTKVAPQLCIDDYRMEEEGINHWLALGKRLLNVREDLPTWLIAIYVLSIMSLCGTILFFDNLLEGNAWCISVAVSGLGLYWFWRKPLKKAKVD